MPENEQLPLFSSDPFIRHQTRPVETPVKSEVATPFKPLALAMANSLLEELKDANFPWPKGVDALTQADWDDYKHKAYDQEWLERRINRMIERGRIPFSTSKLLDKETGELVEAFSHHEYAAFWQYKTGPKPTVSSGHERRKGRKIHAPNPQMERVQTAFNDWARENYLLHEAAYGMEGHKSYLDAAAAHAGNRYFLKVDISSAYDAVDPQRLAVQLAQTDGAPIGPGGWFPIVRRFFVPPNQTKGLATGGNASPLLFNIYMRPIDEVISLYARAYGMTYTRYMDDIVLSAPDTGNPDFDRIGRGKAKFVKRALANIGMEVNDHKVRYKDLQTDGPILLTGAQLDGEGNWQIPAKSVKNIAAFLDNAQEVIHFCHDIPEHDLLTLVGEIYGINSYIQHFISRREGPIHPSEQMLFAKYHACVVAIWKRWPAGPPNRLNKEQGYDGEA